MRITLTGAHMFARSDIARIILRAHADRKHWAVRHPTGICAATEDAGDYAELVL